MIRALSAVIVAVALVLVVDGGQADPGPRLAADRMVATRASTALEALDALEAAIAPGLEAARRGAARTVGGNGPPGEALEAGAALIAEAADEAARVRSALGDFDAALLARDPSAEPVGEPVPSGELASIATQLEATAPAADSFAGHRERARGLVATLEDALAALEGGALDRAAALADEARTDHAALLEWEVDLVTLPVWLDTTDAMITAVEDLVDATQAADAAAAGEAAEAFAALADEAAPADRALRIAIGEGGSSIAAAPLERLATVLRATEAARTRLMAVS